LSTFDWIVLLVGLGLCIVSVLLVIALRDAIEDETDTEEPEPAVGSLVDSQRRLHYFVVRSEMRADVRRTRREFDRRVAEFKRNRGGFRG